MPSWNLNGITFANNNDGSFNLKGSLANDVVQKTYFQDTKNSHNTFFKAGYYTISSFDTQFNEGNANYFQIDIVYNGTTYYDYFQLNEKHELRSKNITKEMLNYSDFKIGYHCYTAISISKNVDIYFKPQLEYGNKATSYEPYKEKRYTINLIDINGNTINGLGKDDILQKWNNKWIIKNDDKLIELSSETSKVLNNISIYDGVSNIYIDDVVTPTNISFDYLI